MKKISSIVICLTLLLTTVPLILADSDANNIDITWMKTYGRFFNEELGVSVQQTNDGGFIAVGSISKSLFDVRGNKDVWLIKFDETGSILWNKTFGGKRDDEGTHVQQTKDGGYIIIGETESFSDDKRDDIWLIKTDENGEKIWDKTVGKSGFDSGKEVIQTTDGGYALVGWGNQSGGGRGNVLVMKVDGDGNMLWEQYFGEKGHNYGKGIRETDDGGFIIIGSSYIPDESNDYDMWLIKVDKDGEMRWDKKFDGTNSDFGGKIDVTVDGGFIILGTTNYDGFSGGDIWLIKTDEHGTILWDKTFPGRGSSIQQTSDGGFIIGSNERKDNYFDFNDGLLIKTDANGIQQWRQTFSFSESGVGADVFSSVQQTSDGGFIVTGFTAPWNARFGYDLWLLKINPEDYPKITSNMNKENMDVTIDGKIQCSSKPFIRCDDEHFYVTVNNSGDTDVSVMVNFYIWDEDDKEYEWFDDAETYVPAGGCNTSDPADADLIWPGSWNAEPWGLYWPGRFIPRYMKATVEYNDEILDTQENRFFMGFLIF
ncbi:MAG: hypothetical protein R6U21_01000 [Thermoplasmatota archaeon]